VPKNAQTLNVSTKKASCETFCTKKGAHNMLVKLTPEQFIAICGEKKRVEGKKLTK
jgi:hypothetical protein